MSSPAHNAQASDTFQHRGWEKYIDYYQKKPHSLSRLLYRIGNTYLRPFWRLMGLAIITNAMVAATTGAIPWIIQQSIDNVFENKSASALYIITAALVIISVVRAVTLYLSNGLLNYVQEKASANMQKDLFSVLVHGDIAFVSNRHSAEFTTIFLNDVRHLRVMLSTAIIGVARYFLTIVGLIGVMFAMNWKLAIIFTLIVLPLGYFVVRGLGQRARKSTQYSLEETGTLSAFLTDTLTGLRIVKAYGQESNQLTRAQTTINSILRHAMRSLRAQNAAGPAIEILAGIAIAAIMYFGGRASLVGELTGGQFMGFISALLLTYQPMRALAHLQAAIYAGVAGANRLFAVLDTKFNITVKPNAKALKIDKGEIHFDNINFNYNDDSIAVRDFSCVIKPGKTVALVGHSGSGKTTVFNLLMRFFDAKTGKISIDGQDITNVTTASLRQNMALVTQEPFLFDDTIAHNIGYGRADASHADIEAAAQLAAGDEFIETLADGYQTRVGENGLRLSGGQRQRIAIARAILKDAPILLLDEATAALDNESEARVQQALATLMRGRTVLVIAHRLSTIINADHIYVMQNGTIVEDGTHKTLLEQNGIYTRFHKSQDVYADAPLASKTE